MIRSFDPDRPEWMDVADTVTPELERDLANLDRLNRWFGGRALVRQHLPALLPPGGQMHLLDLATGGGDLPRLAVRLARNRGCALRVTAVDRQEPVLEIARRRSRKFPEIEFVRGDIRDFTPAEPPDVVMCHLALHHFDEADVLRILRRSRQQAGRAVLVSDLRRSRAAQLGIFLLTAVVFREAMTRHDARLSVRRAFSFVELQRLAIAAGWSGFRHLRARSFRQVLLLDRQTVRRRTAFSL